MNPVDAKSEAPAPLPVRSRCIYGGSSDVEIRRSVHCPRRGGSFNVGVCQTCSCYAGLSLNSAQALVLCADDTARTWHASQPSFPGHTPTEADRTPVSTIMSPTVICVRPEVSIEDAGALLVEHRIGALPVVDARGHPLGVVSKTDLLRDAVEGDGDDGFARVCDSEEGVDCVGTVDELVVQSAFTLPEQATISEAAAQMAFEGVHRLPVVNSEREIVGIVSALDVLAWLAHHDGYVFRAGRHRVRF